MKIIKESSKYVNKILPSSFFSGIRVRACTNESWENMEL